MRANRSLSVTLPDEMVRMVEAKVASGEYASESEVVRDGLNALASRATDAKAWLQEEIVTAYDDAIGSGKTLSARDAWARIEAHMNTGGSTSGDASR